MGDSCLSWAITFIVPPPSCAITFLFPLPSTCQHQPFPFPYLIHVLSLFFVKVQYPYKFAKLQTIRVKVLNG